MTWRDRLILKCTRSLPVSAFSVRISRFLDPEVFTGTVRFEARGGLRFDLDLSDHQTRQIYTYGVYEANCVRWMRRLVKPGMVVVDAGANLGQYTLLGAKLVAPGGSVHAFEPEPSNRAKLLSNLSLNPGLVPRVTVNPEGLGDRRCKTWIYSPAPGNTGTASVFQKSRPAESGHAMEMICLDEYLDANVSGNVDFLKIDVEGCELKVLQGAKAHLAAPGRRAVLCEISAEALRTAGTTPQEVGDFMKSFGFTAYVPRAFPLPLIPIPRISSVIFDNILFLRK